MADEVEVEADIEIGLENSNCLRLVCEAQSPVVAVANALDVPLMTTYSTAVPSRNIPKLSPNALGFRL